MVLLLGHRNTRSTIRRSNRNLRKLEIKIRISAEDNTINVLISDEELAERKAKWIAPEPKHKKGILYKYAKTVASASKGCVTDL
jgi:dihydroxy-acid dehydratase